MSLSKSVLSWSIIGIATVGFLVFRVKNNQTGSVGDNPNSIAREPVIRKASVRKADRPNGNFPLDVTRLPQPQLPLVAMDDKGDFLFLADELHRQYQFFTNGKLETVDSPAVNVQECLIPSGQIVKLTDEPIVPLTSPLSFPYREEITQPYFFSDGSIAFSKPVRLQYMREHFHDFRLPAKYANFKHDFFTLRREVFECTQVPSQQNQGSAPRMRPNFSQAPAQSNQPLDHPLSGASSGGITTASNFTNKVLRSTEIYASEKMLTTLCIESDDTIWVAEHTGFVTAGSDQLLKFIGNSKEVIPLPKGYHNVHRVVASGGEVVASGGEVVATFGILNGNEPFRSFTLKGSDWSELPIPEGFDCSFAQQVFTNGMILGYITSWDGTKLKSVVWDGPKMSILNDSPAWPKRGDISLVTHANHAGVLAVQNVTNAASGASEYYLLKLKL